VSDPVLTPPAATRLFRVVAIAEACSWAGLLVGMLFKYVATGSDGVGEDVGVAVFGPIHGALFVAYVLITLLTARVLRWDLRTLVIALVASIPPLATLWFERWARRTGRLVQTSASPSAR
jgi:integral membrane protein